MVQVTWLLGGLVASWNAIGCLAPQQWESARRLGALEILVSAVLNHLAIPEGGPHPMRLVMICDL
jgi:hypothetical protein